MGFGGYLAANTAVDVLIGPFVDETDGKTAETALTLSQADIKLSKNGQALAQKNDNTAAAHDANGYYNCELDATDTNTEGTLTLIVHESGALPVRHDFMVISQAAYASIVGAKDSGYMDVNVKAISEDTTAADNCELMFDGTGYGGGTTKLDVNVASIANNAITAAAIATGAIDADAIADNAIDAGAIASDAITAAKIATGAITAAKFASGALDAAALATDAANEIGTAVWATATRTLTAATNITSTGGTIALNGSGYVTYSNTAPPTAAAIADAVWDEARADHTSSGTFGQGVSSVQGNVTGSVASVAGNVGGNVTGSVGSISGVTFPSNFADLAITSSTGRVTVGTNTDKTGYSISGTKTTLDALNDITAASVWSAATRTLTSAENITSTGGTTVPQTGDAYARIGSNGSGLTGIPWNSSWDAEVQSEVFDALDAAYTDATSLTSNGLLDRIRILCWILRNKIEVTDANGNTVIYKDDSTTTAFSVNSMLTDDSTTTTRLRAA